MGMYAPENSAELAGAITKLLRAADSDGVLNVPDPVPSGDGRRVTVETLAGDFYEVTIRQVPAPWEHQES